MHTLISAKPSSTSSLVSAMPSMPATFVTWRTSTASNQPQRRLRPVTVPNFWPRSPISSPVVVELGREGPGADARGVRLGDAEHIADGARPHAGAGRRLRRDRVGRGHERVRAVVDVEQRALRALEQDALPSRRARSSIPGHVHVGQDLGRDLGEFGEQLVFGDLGLAEASRQHVVVHRMRSTLGPSACRASSAALHADGAPADLVLVGRADAAAGGADLARARRLLADDVELAMERQDEGCVLGNAQVLAPDPHALPLSRSISAHSAHGSTTTPLPITASCPAAPRPRAAATA